MIYISNKKFCDILSVVVKLHYMFLALSYSFTACISVISTELLFAFWNNFINKIVSVAC